ncbi:sugar O-acetyltransferase [Shewanella sp. 10N.261.52.F9]
MNQSPSSKQSANQTLETRAQQIDEFAKMLSGSPYQCLDPQLNQFWRQQQVRNQQMNINGKIDTELLANIATSATIMLPFYVSYGLNIKLGEQAFINANCTLHDNAMISIGSQTMLGPNVQIYTAQHPLDATERCAGIETAKAVTIGSRAWIGGGAIILPGVSIGDEAVVGAGSVVTKDVQAKQVVAGNPARVIKTL